MSDPRAERLQAFLAREAGQPRLVVRSFGELIAGWSRTTCTAELASAGALPARVVIQVERPDGLVVGSSVARDFRLLGVLGRAGLPVPPALFASDDPAVMGGPFMVTGFLAGRSVDTSSPAERAGLLAQWNHGSPLAASLVDALAAVHACPLDDLGFLPAAPDGASTALWELERCRGLLREARVEGDPVVALALHWLERHRPPAGRLALVHGDFHMRNLLVEGERLSGVLDWEAARVSDPLFDLAYMSIPYLAGKFFVPATDLVGALMPLPWLLEQYARRTGHEVPDDGFRFWRVLATLTLFAIVAKGVSDFEDGKLSSIRNAWARFSEPVLHEDLLALLRTATA